MHKKSFTIVELLVYMGLLAILLTVLTDIFATMLSLQTESESVSVVQQDGRYILGKLIFDINQASDISVPNQLGDSGNILTVNVNGSNQEYRLLNSELQLTNIYGTNNLNSSDTAVDSINFKRTGNIGGKNTIVIDLTISSRATPQSGKEIKNYHTTVGLR